MKSGDLICADYQDNYPVIFGVVMRSDGRTVEYVDLDGNLHRAPKVWCYRAAWTFTGPRAMGSIYDEVPSPIGS